MEPTPLSFCTGSILHPTPHSTHQSRPPSHQSCHFHSRATTGAWTDGGQQSQPRHLQQDVWLVSLNKSLLRSRHWCPLAAQAWEGVHIMSGGRAGREAAIVVWAKKQPLGSAQPWAHFVSAAAWLPSTPLQQLQKPTTAPALRPPQPPPPPRWQRLQSAHTGAGSCQHWRRAAPPSPGWE
jgi:hypothetical protein